MIMTKPIVNATKYFLNGKNKKNKKLFYKIIDICFDFINGKDRNHKVINYEKTDFFKTRMSEPLPTNGIEYNEVEELLRFIGKYSISQSDLNYLAFPDSGNSIPGLIGDIYSKFINQNLIAFDRSAPIATFLEIQLLEWLRELIGYEHKEMKEIKALSEVAGICTTGGHMSNHIAILTALNEKYSNIKEKGLSSLGHTPKVLLASKISHYSLSSAVHHLGIGLENIISINTNADFTTDLNDLELKLKKHQESNDIFIVVAAAGNTRTGGMDDLQKISSICKKFNVWFHVDACHGGSLIFSKALKKKYLNGIEEADSISLDPHKGNVCCISVKLCYV